MGSRGLARSYALAAVCADIGQQVGLAYILYGAWGVRLLLRLSGVDGFFVSCGEKTRGWTDRRGGHRDGCAGWYC
ncbi:MAG: hypothetical protein HG459_003325 [Bacteroidia bacterium]|nr:hypothetical protein [Bacteroidia bacterium]